MNLNDVYSIIDGFSEEAFEKCSSMLYKTLGFKVLKLEDVRPVDLKEGIAHWIDNNSKWYDKKVDRFSEKALENQYLIYTEGIISRYIQFQGARALKYDERRRGLAEKLLGGKASASDFEDYVFIFLMQCWDFTQDEDYKGQHQTDQENSFSCAPDDFVTVQRLSRLAYYDKEIEAKVKLRKKKTEWLYNHGREYLLIINTIMLTKLLQDGGYY